MLGIIKFAVWIFLVMIVAAFVLLALQLFGFFLPVGCFNDRAEKFDDLIKEVRKIPEGEEKMMKFDLCCGRVCIENITKKDKRVCMYSEKDARCWEVNIKFLDKEGKIVEVIKPPGIYLVKITKNELELQKI